MVYSYMYSRFEAKKPEDEAIVYIQKHTKTWLGQGQERVQTHKGYSIIVRDLDVDSCQLHRRLYIHVYVCTYMYMHFELYCLLSTQTAVTIGTDECR